MLAVVLGTVDACAAIGMNSKPSAAKAKSGLRGTAFNFTGVSPSKVSGFGHAGLHTFADSNIYRPSGRNTLSDGSN
jgi:hypothetical protein